MRITPSGKDSEVPTYVLTSKICLKNQPLLKSELSECPENIYNFLLFASERIWFVYYDLLDLESVQKMDRDPQPCRLLRIAWPTRIRRACSGWTASCSQPLPSCSSNRKAPVLTALPPWGAAVQRRHRFHLLVDGDCRPPEIGGRTAAVPLQVGTIYLG